MYVLRVKPGVKFDVIAPAGFAILSALEQACQHCETDLVITCGSDSHPPTDPHSRGEAYDVRVADLEPGVILMLVKALWNLLGSEYFYLQYEVQELPDDAGLRAIAHVGPDATAAHIHIQVKKATKYPPLPPGATVQA